MDLRPSYQDKTVLVTGHTGFKGAWLCEWLLMLGARVVGIALPTQHPARPLRPARPCGTP
ncbi:NAD-dependent epimerase/dehydratase family protein [Thiocapsa imhoffii]|uniref:NAD-dependent epimerase/dehydratase family protein n=1 Tax=Thiocapsa imhoffii TaxID=382777 RepID=UPI0030B90882